MRSLLPRRPTAPAPAPGYVDLQGRGARAVLVPALGGRVAALEVGGRQWLLADVDGGYRDRVSAAPVRAGVPPLATGPLAGPELSLPDAGALEEVTPTIDVRTLPDAHEATCRWRAGGTGGGAFELERTLRVAAGAITMRYALRNVGSAPLAAEWSALALVPLTPATRLVVPEGAPVRVRAQEGIDLLGEGAEHRWPRLRGAKRIADFSSPDAIARRFAVRVDVAPLPGGLVGLVEGDARLDARLDASAGASPVLGLQLVRRRRTRYGALGLGPHLVLALSLDGAPLEPGASREWTVQLEGRG